LRPQIEKAARGFCDAILIDEVLIMIQGQTLYLSRAVDQHSDVADGLWQERRVRQRLDGSSRDAGMRTAPDRGRRWRIN